MVANRLSTSGRMWTQIFSKHNSGTYNNQWMVVDYKRFVPGGQPKSGVLYVLEQLPGFIRYDDLTAHLLRHQYWASYNVPYFTDVFEMGGNKPLVERFGDWFTYENSPRARIFRRDQASQVEGRGKSQINMKSQRKSRKYRRKSLGWHRFQTKKSEKR